jgi:hypothetical protein
MVQRRTIEFIDDIDGGRADETVRFSLDGRDYEIDLSIDHARLLRDALQPYVSVARRTGMHRLAHTAPDGEAPADDSQEIRAWARARGLDVSNRGRIPAYLRQAWERR